MIIAGFDAFPDVQRDDARSELIDGRILAMTDASFDHAEIVGNISGALQPTLAAERRCRLTPGIRVQASDDACGRDAPRPDVIVYFGVQEASRAFVTTPLGIVEVLVMTLTRPYEALVFEALDFTMPPSDVYGGVVLPAGSACPASW